VTTPLRQQLDELDVPEENLLFVISPCDTPPLQDAYLMVKQALAHPIGSPPLPCFVKRGDRVLIIADDLTRPTPQSLILPPILEELNVAGVPDRNILVLIALGTHRKMTQAEIISRFGVNTTRRVKIINHDYSNPRALVRCGETSEGTPILVNREVLKADVVIGVGSIVPHAQVGWGGGAKIILPGVCGEKSVEVFHQRAAARPDYLHLMGTVENPLRKDMEQIAYKVGLRFILNVVFNASYEPIKFFAGDTIAAHRQGVELAKKIFVRPIPARADIVIVEAEPADLDYWQGLKPLTAAVLGLKKGGFIVLVGHFPDGVSPTHPECSLHGTKSKEELNRLLDAGELTDGVCAAALVQHALIKETAQIYCVSPGLTSVDMTRLGFRGFADTQSALTVAIEHKGPNATVGIIRKGGDVLPTEE
jgi:lactate racemase